MTFRKKLAWSIFWATVFVGIELVGVYAATSWIDFGIRDKQVVPSILKIIAPVLWVFGATFTWALLLIDASAVVIRRVYIRSGSSAPADGRDVLVWVRRGDEDEYLWEIASCIDNNGVRTWISIHGTELIDENTMRPGEPKWYCNLPAPRTSR